MANRLLELLEKPFIVGDGAMGTMLQSTGLFTGLCPEELNLTHPDAIKSVHAMYVEAGADMLETNSFGGTRIKLETAQFGGSVYEVNRAAASIAREAAGEHVVLGSVGPLGHLLDPYGEVAYDDAVENFREQAQALADGGADGLIIETMFDLNEVKAALQGNRGGPNLPVVCTMTFDTHLHTMFGVSPAQAVKELQELGVVLIGANCGTGPEEMLDVIRQMQAACPGANLIIQPNAGMPEMAEDGTVAHRMEPDAMAIYAAKFKAMGVKAIGSCCGSTPDHTRMIAAAVTGEPVHWLRMGPCPGAALDRPAGRELLGAERPGAEQEYRPGDHEPPDPSSSSPNAPQPPGRSCRGTAAPRSSGGRPRRPRGGTSG